jgi:hypothetical protein
MDAKDKIHYTKKGRYAPVRKAFDKPILRKFCKTHGHTPWMIGWYRHPGVCMFYKPEGNVCGCSEIGHIMSGKKDDYPIEHPKKPCHGGVQMMYYCVKCIKAGGYGPIGADE